ncbi:hypothetical protein [Tessaracoccus antarcticus]|uniref:Uncharacterized protein n=1 Tax=Tessaracoccus antarcticus TaxID=2479848 RepID=A0A3M0G945_9ACTN|nr:hypothetical protein [Tessaracoccus antarcticus]RMB61511.1 hypothetical protein EAX62_02390 [Tessaracoccus antarcticus]
MTETFFAWQRSGVSALAGPTYAEGRMQGELVVTLDDGAARDGSAPFLFAGPQDVLSLQAGVIVGRKPAPGTLDAEITRVAHIELSDPGLPWRYTPLRNQPLLRPWLVLVVGTTGQEVIVDGATVRILNTALVAHPLTNSAGWAHVHAIPGATIARILSPRQLAANASYTAVLVPAIVPGTGANPPQVAWRDGTPEVTLPCHDHWSFRTRDDTDDFRSIAQRLEPLTTAEEEALQSAGFGRAVVTVRGRDDPVLQLGGALSAVDKPPSEPLSDHVGIAEEVEKLAELSEVHGGRWVLGLPRFDEPWAAPGTPVPVSGWRRQLRVDPRHRGTAGLGAWAAIAWQEKIAAGAAQQSGELAVLAERVRNLSLGLHAARRLWTRRLPADPRAAFAVVAPMLSRLPVDGGAVALDRLAGRTSRLVPALFSSGARRMLRPRNALARVAGPGATSLPALIDAAATKCVPPPEPLPGQYELAKAASDPAAREKGANMLRQAGNAFLEVAMEALPQDSKESVGNLPELLRQLSEDTLGRVARPPVEVECSPVADMGALANSVLGGIDPMVARPVVVGRVLDGITGIRQPELAPPDLALELNIPLWSFLQENSPDWLLPGGGELPIDRVHAISTNPEFVDAFLLGANHRALGELRWRNLPLVTGWTPLRRFWQRIDDDGAGPTTDVRPVLDILTGPSPGAPIWTDTSALGDPSHSVGIGAQLVVVLHTELFRRYPATIVYLMLNPGGTATWQDDVDKIVNPRILPNLTGSLHPELVFFGFPLPPTAGKDHWLVLEEPPPGFRFTPPTAAQGPMTDGAAYAKATLNKPIRAFFGKLLPQ